MTQPTYRRKLIEVDLPLDEINAESVRERAVKHGHPSTLHLWWARRPLAACRAVIFASMVDDPSDCAEFETEEEEREERERLHDLIRRLVNRKNSNDEGLIAEARYEIARSVARNRNEDAPTEPAEVLRYLNDKAMPIYDPFAGGGSIPLEAQRLGLRAIASDLNPVAVLINKALIELPPKFAGQPPVNPDADPMGMFTGKYSGRGKNRKPIKVAWRGAAGLANDIRYYGRWMRDEAFKRIGHLYPAAKLPDGGEATVIAWLWARTIPCPNPACGVQMPMMKTFQLSKKANNQYWTKPLVDWDAKSISFVVQSHSKDVPNGATVNRSSVTCIACQTAAPLSYAREQSRVGNMGEQMTAIVAEGDRKRLFLSPTEAHIETALSAKPNESSIPWQKMPTTAYLVSGRGYGIEYWHELFTQRQLTALTTFSDLAPSVRSEIIKHGSDDGYADTICTYLTFVFDKVADMGSSFSRWQNSSGTLKVAGIFARQAIPMMWDFAESNPFSQFAGNWNGNLEWVVRVVEQLPANANTGKVYQADASTTIHANEGPVIVTDPPYYDNISYAELSDFFYVWQRPLLRDTYPDLFSGIGVPQQEEMIAAPRFDKLQEYENAKERFEDLMGKTLKLIRERCSPEFPSSIFYAYKQQEEQHGGRTSTGWQTMLTALVNAGFQIIGTWPMRTEKGNRSNSLSANTLASSVILVCRPRPEGAPVATRRQFLNELERELPAALDHLTREGHIAPVDLAQAAIGPGMQVYSKYIRVETIGGESVSVRDALIQINRVIAEYHEQEQGQLDAQSRFCVDWLRQYGYGSGEYGQAEVLAQAHNVAVEAMPRLLLAEVGKVRLHHPDTYTSNGRMTLDSDITSWEGCMRMSYHLDTAHEGSGGIAGAADVARAMGGDAESVERLARILYEHYDRKNDSANAVKFNNLVTSWQDIVAQAQQPGTGQAALL